jgi:hypothetical protein
VERGRSFDLPLFLIRATDEHREKSKIKTQKAE